MLVKDGRYMEPYIPAGIYKELRTLMDSRWRIMKELFAIKNRISRWNSIYYPEFTKVFADWEEKAANHIYDAGYTVRLVRPFSII
jgi:transposase